MAPLIPSNHSVIENFYQHCGKLLHFIKSRLNNSDDAEDMMQEVFVRLLQYPKEIVPAGINQLAFSIAVNLVNDYLRHLYVKSLAHCNLTFFMDYIINETEEEVVGKDLKRLEETRLSTMPPQRRLVYTLRIHEGRSSKEVAEMLRISPRTAENHFYIGIRQMRECFENNL